LIELIPDDGAAMDMSEMEARWNWAMMVCVSPAMSISNCDDDNCG